jgi:hypothetical protein
MRGRLWALSEFADGATQALLEAGQDVTILLPRRIKKRDHSTLVLVGLGRVDLQEYSAPVASRPSG